MYNLLLTILLVLSVQLRTNPAMYLMPAQVICLNVVKRVVLKL